MHTYRGLQCECRCCQLSWKFRALYPCWIQPHSCHWSARSDRQNEVQPERQETLNLPDWQISPWKWPTITVRSVSQLSPMYTVTATHLTPEANLSVSPLAENQLSDAVSHLSSGQTSRLSRERSYHSIQRALRVRRSDCNSGLWQKQNKLRTVSKSKLDLELTGWAGTICMLFDDCSCFCISGVSSRPMNSFNDGYSSPPWAAELLPLPGGWMS